MNSTQAGCRAGNQVNTEVHDRAWKQVVHQTGSRVTASFWARAGDPVAVQVDEQVENQVRDQIGDRWVPALHDGIQRWPLVRTGDRRFEVQSRLPE